MKMSASEVFPSISNLHIYVVFALHIFAWSFISSSQRRFRRMPDFSSFLFSLFFFFFFFSTGPFITKNSKGFIIEPEGTSKVFETIISVAINSVCCLGSNEYVSGSNFGELFLFHRNG